MTNPLPTVALIMDHFLTVYQTTVRDAIEFEAKNRGVNLLCIIGRALDSPLVHERVQNAVFDDVTKSSVQGVVVLGTTLSTFAGKDRVDEFCRRYELPVCNIGLRLSDIPSVFLNNRRFKAIVRHLAVEHKCRRIAFLGGPPANEEAEIRRNAFLEGLEECGLPFDRDLEKTGKFTLQSGHEAAVQLLAEKKPFDALVAANDNMAIGAIAVLKTRGLRVPEDVRVTGFDDTLAARFHTPPLTTMRQPLEIIGRTALSLVLRQIEGETVPLLTELDPVLYCRQSCGCDPGRAYQILRRTYSSNKPLMAAFADQRDELAARLEQHVQIPKESFDSWIERLLFALEKEISGQSGCLMDFLRELLDSAGWRRWLLDEFQSVISLLRQHFPYSKKAEIDMEGLWHAARMFLSDASAKEQMKQQVDPDLASSLFIQRAAADLPDRLTREALVNAIGGELESIGIVNAAVMVFQKDTTRTLDVIVGIKDGKQVDTTGMTCDAGQLLPEMLLTSKGARSFVVVPLSLGKDRLGRMVLDLGAPDLYYEMLREHLSSYLKSIASHQRQLEKLKATEDAYRQELEMQHRQKLESLGVLAGGIAHDFNNMLAVMVGNLDATLLEMESQSPLRDPVMECKNVAKHAGRLCRQLLAYSGKGNLVVERVNLNSIIRDLEDLLRMSVSKNARLVFDLLEELPEIEGDVAQLNQIFVNLVINASESMGENGGTIEVHTTSSFKQADYFHQTYTEAELDSGEYVIATVADNGSGISKETLAQIFDPFFSTKFTGRGLGLAAVLGIVRSHRGAIRVQSEVGRGTQFEVLFPPLPTKSTTSQGTSSSPNVKGRGTLLLVDDEPGVLRIGERLLKHLGFSVMLANNGQKAKEIFRDLKEDITCVILDITMPGMGGIAIMEQLREIRRDVPIILSSGYAETEVTKGLDNGPDAFLQKPYDFKQLNKTLGKVLKKNMGGNMGSKPST